MCLISTKFVLRPSKLLAVRSIKWWYFGFLLARKWNNGFLKKTLQGHPSVAREFRSNASKEILSSIVNALNIMNFPHTMHDNGWFTEITKIAVFKIGIALYGKSRELYGVWKRADSANSTHHSTRKGYREPYIFMVDTGKIELLVKKKHNFSELSGFDSQCVRLTLLPWINRLFFFLSITS